MSLFDENAWVLGKLEAEGRDLGPPRVVDFSHIFPDPASADAFAQEARRAGFSATTDEIEREGKPWWDVTASKEMTPTCDKITDTEERLDALARSLRGRADGWGFLNV